MEDNKPLVKVDRGIKFEKDLKKLRKNYRSVDKDIKPLINQLESGETPGDRIDGNKYSVYKVRLKNSNIQSGKSGGYRTIYYIRTPESVLLTSIYSKSQQENISNLEIEQIILNEEMIQAEQLAQTSKETDAIDEKLQEEPESQTDELIDI